MVAFAPDEKLRDFAKLVEFMGGHTVESKNVIQATRRIEAKSAVLLAHVSLMIAVTGVLWATVEDQAYFELLFAAELILYLALAIVCICIQWERSPLKAWRISLKPSGDGQITHQQDRANISECQWKLLWFRRVQVALPVLTVFLVATIVARVVDAAVLKYLYAVIEVLA
jgi:hypothetical protein